MKSILFVYLFFPLEWNQKPIFFVSSVYNLQVWLSFVITTRTCVQLMRKSIKTWKKSVKEECIVYNVRYKKTQEEAGETSPNSDPRPTPIN